MQPCSPRSPARFAFTIALLAAWHAAACDSGTVRDAAFHEPRDMHRLCVFSPSGDPAGDEIFQDLTAWSQNEGKDLNLLVEHVDAADENVRWMDYGIPSAPPDLPAVALIGTFPAPKRPFVIDHWEPGPTEGDLAILCSSPARKRLIEAIVDSWAVILYSPGPEGERPESRKVLDAAIERWREEQSPGIAVVSFDRTDSAERLLTAFTGLTPADADWLGVIFGRGKLLAPPLRGDEITETNVNQLLQSLAMQCTCLQEAMTIGLDIPLEWERTLDTKVVAMPITQGYVEMSLDAIAVGAPLTSPATASAPAPSAAPPELDIDIPDQGRGVVLTALLTIGAATLLAISASFLIWFRARKRVVDPPAEPPEVE